MTKIEQIKADLALSRKVEVIQKMDEHNLRHQWEEAIRRREETTSRIDELLKELKSESKYFAQGGQNAGSMV